MKVGGDAIFSAAMFEGWANFAGAYVASNFQAVGAKFQNKEKTASFNPMKVGGDASFDKAMFEGPVNFTGADIAGNFEAQFAKFHNRKKGANFGGK